MTEAERNALIEECAVAAEAQDRTGREWVRDSLWDAILKRAGRNVRALKTKCGCGRKPGECVKGDLTVCPIITDEDMGLNDDCSRCGAMECRCHL